MKKVYLFILLSFTLAGCGYGGTKDKDHANGNGITSVNYHKGESVNQDMITDQNPNLLNLNTDENSSRNNKGMDVDKARDVITRNNQYEVGPIWINGQDMHVTVYSNDNLSAKQSRNAKSQLHKDLMRALPSYMIHVKVKNR